MAGPWEAYAVADAGAAKGPWARYGAPKEEAPEPSFFDRMFEGDANADKPLLERGTNKVVMDTGRAVARQVGLTARAGLKGSMSLLAMPGDALGMRSTQSVEGLANMMNLPTPETPIERFSDDVVSGMAGVAPVIGLGKLMYNAGSRVVSSIGDLLRSQRMLQTVSSATGSAASSIVRESGGGVGAQLAAGVTFGLVPAVAVAGIPALLRRIMRGGEEGRQVVEQNLQTFQKSGYGSPTVGQASEARLPRAIESTLAKTPGSAGRMVDKAETGATGIGERIEDMATDLSSKSGAAPAGRAIAGGIREFTKDFKDQSGKLYDVLDTHIAKDKPIDMTNTANALTALNADIQGAPELSKLFKNGTIQAIEAAMKSDTGDFTTKLPYEAMKKLRTLVGQEIENTNLTSSVPRSKWKALYGALSEDLGEAATAAGPDAVKAYERANTYYGAGMKRIDDVLQPILNKADPEDIFKAAISGTKEGATTISGVMKSLPEDSRKVVASTMLRRLGRATAGQQDDLGETFSTETFLTNWNKIAPDAKTQLFGSMSAPMRKNLDEIAEVASNIRQGSKVFANPSGTQQAVSSQLAGGGALVALFTGHPEVSAAIGATALGANLTARLMTSAEFVKWLAKATRAPTGAIGGELNTLAEISGKWNTEDKAAAADYLSAARKLEGRRQ